MFPQLWARHQTHPVILRTPNAPHHITLTTRFPSRLTTSQPLLTAIQKALLTLTLPLTATTTDSGVTCLGIASTLLSSGQCLLQQGYFMPDLVDEWSAGLDLAVRYLHQHQSRRITFSDLPTMKCVVLSMLYPNVVIFPDAEGNGNENDRISTTAHREKLASSILDALLSSLDAQAEPCVHVLPVEGSAVHHSFSAPNTVLMDIPLPSSRQLCQWREAAAGTATATAKQRHGENWEELQLQQQHQGFTFALFDTSLESITLSSFNSNNSNNTQLGGINLVQQSIDENLFKWQDAITDVIEDLTNLRLEAASKGQTANEETLKRALNQAKVASESFLISSGNNRTGDDEEEDPATNLIRKVSSSFDEQNDDFDIRTRAASEKLRAESRAKQESMDSF